MLGGVDVYPVRSLVEIIHFVNSSRRRDSALRDW
jgi:hypothetical protein